MNIVVGSGPAGVACAAALRKAGAPVLILDAGMELEAELSARKAALAALEPEKWSGPDAAFLYPPIAEPGGVPDKLAYGSDFACRPVPGEPPVELNQAALKPSFAVGGLSTVWGAASMPWQARDLKGWPVGLAELEAGYRAAAGLMPLAGVVDDLAESFPFYDAPRPPVALSRQAEGALKTLTRNRTALAARGLSFGRARLAMDASRCATCGLCLRGCPRDLIFSTRGALDDLRAGGASYQSRILVRAVEETPNGVIVRGTTRDGATLSIEGQRVFLAAGVVSTTEIMLRSLGWRDRAVEIMDSQYFVVPVARASGAGDVRAERLHTLSQIFLELNDASVSPHTMHMQLYSYNDMIGAALDAKLGPLSRSGLGTMLLGRLMALQGYLHSDQSGRIAARLSGAGDGRMSLTGSMSDRARAGVSLLIGKLLRLAPRSGLLPLPPLAEIPAPGRGFHSGGSFPMARDPRMGQCDIWGRPHGYSRVHLADASTFPSIPTPTITFSAMANAWRIGAAATRSFSE